MPEDTRWQASLLGTARPARSDEIRVKGDATIWQIHPAGLDCALLIAEALPLAHAEPFTMTIPGQKRTDRTPVVLTFYRARPIPSAQTPPADALTVNLGEGWRLLKLDAPDSARAGEQVTVIHEWLVGQPPNEPHWFWYFAPFVKLFAPDERMVLEIDSAPAILGYAWRTGYVQVSMVRFTLPADLPPGNYTLELSLFDPNPEEERGVLSSKPAANAHCYNTEGHPCVGLCCSVCREFIPIKVKELACFTIISSMLLSSAPAARA